MDPGFPGGDTHDTPPFGPTQTRRTLSKNLRPLLCTLGHRVFTPTRPGLTVGVRESEKVGVGVEAGSRYQVSLKCERLRSRADGTSCPTSGTKL